MTQYYVSWSDGAASDANAGTNSALPWKTMGKVRGFTFANGDIVSFKRGDTWISDTPGSFGLLEVPHASMTFNAYGSGAKPLFELPKPAAVTITSIVVGASTATVTATAHGFNNSGAGYDFIQIAGVTGAAASANGFWTATYVDANTFTIPLGGSLGTSTNGTCQLQYARSLACIYNNGKDNCTFQDLALKGGNNNSLLAGASITAMLYQRIDSSYAGAHGFANTGSGTGVVYDACNVSYCRNDGINFNGTTPYYANGFVCKNNITDHIGYNSNGTVSGLGGAGDGVTAHTGSYGDSWNNQISYSYQGGITFVNTTGTNRIFNNFITEVAGSGINIGSGGTATIFRNIVIAPVNSALDATSTHACILLSGTSPGNVYNNSCYTARGQVGGSGGTTPVYAFAMRGTGAVTAKNNLWLSNGTAPLYSVNTTSGGAYTGQNNAVSHPAATLIVTSAGNKVWSNGTTGWVDTTFNANFTTPDATGWQSVNAASIETLPPTTVANFRLVIGSNARNNGQDLSGLGITELSTDPLGVTVPQQSSWDIGALEFKPVGTITGTGIASGEALGVGTISVGVNGSGFGIASAEAFGVGAISAGINGSGFSIASSGAFGVGAITAGINGSGFGIASSGAFGLGVVANSSPPPSGGEENENIKMSLTVNITKFPPAASFKITCNTTATLLATFAASLKIRQVRISASAACEVRISAAVNGGTATTPTAIANNDASGYVVGLGANIGEVVLNSDKEQFITEIRGIADTASVGLKILALSDPSSAY